MRTGKRRLREYLVALPETDKKIRIETALLPWDLNDWTRILQVVLQAPNFYSPAENCIQIYFEFLEALSGRSLRRNLVSLSCSAPDS